MACGEPSPSFMKQMQMSLCQLCGQNMQSSGNRESVVNYQKQVDPPALRYSQILPDYRYDIDEEQFLRRKGKLNKPAKSAPLQICVPIPVVPGKSCPETAPTENEAKPSPPKPEEPASKDKTQAPATGTSTALKASCFPAGGCPPPVKMMLCLPCPPPDGAGSSSGASGSAPCPKAKPTDYTYRCESRELRGGNLYQCCQCNKRNGLQHDCPRTPCQGRPACLTKPWPDCWPSGGCHGIDYTREKGVKRVDPSQQRWDKKECKPPGGAKADCGGNMMVVVCPQPSPPNC